MANVRDLRKRCALTTELINEQAQRITEDVMNFVKSDAMQISLRNRDLVSDNPEEVAKIDAEMSSKFKETLLENTLNPVTRFTDECQKRGLKNSAIRKLVKRIDEMFALSKPDDDYETKKYNVALYLQAHPDLYNEINYTL